MIVDFLEQLPAVGSTSVSKTAGNNSGAVGVSGSKGVSNSNPFL
jgi:hypothetical protein